MKIGLTIFCLILYTSAQSCVSNVQYYELCATENETQEWDMSTIFFTGNNLKFNITQESNYFEVLNPLHSLGSSKNALEVKILSLKPLYQNYYGGWANAFAALGQNQTYFQILYSKDGILNQVTVPIFNESIKVREITDNFTCFDLDFLSETKIIIDCTLPYSELSQTPINGLFIIDVEEKSYFGIELIEDTQDYNDTQYRILQFHINQFEGHQEANLLFRAEPAWGTKKALQNLILEEDSKINVFKLISNFTLCPTPVAVLTKTILADLLGVDEGKIKFQLIDYKIEANSRINVLDSTNGVYVLFFSKNNLEWQLDTTIRFPLVMNCLGFDILNVFNKDGSTTKKIVIVSQGKLILFINGVQHFGLHIPMIEWYNTFQIKLSQKYIILKIRKTIFIYNINNGKQIFTQEEDLDIIISNPNYDEVIGINSQIAKRFLLNNGLLKLNKPDKDTSSSKIVTLTAETIEQPSKQCQVKIYLNVVKRNERQIQLFHRALNPVITIPSNPILLDQIASGPNLQFKSVDFKENKLQEEISYTIQQVRKLSIVNIHMPDPKDIVYSDILVNEDPAQFHLFLQVSSRIVYLYTCQHLPQNLEFAECFLFNSFSLRFIIDQSVRYFTWQANDKGVILIQQDSQFSISIYSVEGGSMKILGQINFDSTSFSNSISSVEILSDGIYTVQSELKRVCIFSLNPPYRLLFTIDENSIKQFQYKGLFTPKKVFGNKNYNLLFIQTETALLIGTFSNTKSTSFQIHKEISILQGSEVTVAIGVNTFFLIQTKKGLDQIEEYNYQHLQNIFKLKDIPLFHYNIQQPLTVDYSFQTGWLYVRATDGLQTVILVYESNALAHSSLNKVLETNEFLKDGLDLDIAVDGGDQMFFYYNNNTHHQFMSILSKAQFQFTLKPDQLEYVNDQIVKIEITGFSSVTPKNLLNQITILNTQSQLFIAQSLFDSKKKIFQFVKQSGFQRINMGTEWYSGQVTNFDMKCSKCTGQFKIEPNIYKVRSDNYYDQVVDGASFGQTGQVFQNKNALMFENIKGQFMNEIKMNLKTEQCNSISISADQTLILSTFQNQNNESGLFIHKCKYFDSCFQFRQGIQTFTGQQKFEKTIMPDQKNIIIFSCDYFSAQLNSIIVSTLYDDGTQFIISQKYVINNQYVGSNQIQIGDFDIIKYQIGNNFFATILFTDIKNGIYFAHFTHSDSGFLVKTTSELFKLINFYNDQYYIDEDTKFQQVKVISTQLNGTILQLNVLVSTNNYAQYVFAFDLDASRPTFGLPIKKSSTQLLYVLTPYGSWPALNKASYIDGNVAIPYANGQKVVIGIYPLPSGRPSSTKIIPFTHSISSDYHKQITREDFIMLFNRNAQDKYPYFFANLNYDARYDEYLVAQYQLRSDPFIYLSDTTNYENELVIDLYLNNDFYQIQGQATLQSNSSIDKINPVGEDINFLS